MDILNRLLGYSVHAQEYVVQPEALFALLGGLVPIITGNVLIIGNPLLFNLDLLSTIFPRLPSLP
jgi:hypothetical protein